MLMAHPPPPLGPPPEEEQFRLAVYHFKRKTVRNRNGGQDRVRQIIYRSAWYPTVGQVRMLQAEIKTFLERNCMLGLFESFTHWRIQKWSDVQWAIERRQATERAQEGHWAQSFNSWPRGATDGMGVSMSSDSRSSDSR